MYVFDPLADRVFYMELSKIEFGKGCDAAICVKSTGEAPKQTLNFDELMKKEVPGATTESDFEEDFYGSDAYNDDDIDPDGFDMGGHDRLQIGASGKGIRGLGNGNKLGARVD